MQAPAADPVNATTSSVDRDPGFLDAAIRACSSVEDFVAGAALHPLLLGDLEPIALLQERCPEADLADYSTCVSLIHALATPAPTARPTATPPATPRPRATSKPKATPTATPRPQTGSATGTRADGKVRVPAIRATVRGATRVVYFDIRGRTWDQLNRSTAKHTARLCRDHQARACLETRISNVRPRVRQDRQTGACTLTGLSADLTMVAYMPRWSAPKRVSPALAWVWRKSIARTGWHEAQHAKIAARHFARLSKLVAGKPCSKFAAVTRKWWKRLTRAQHRFDEVDYRRSAAVHARWWQRAYARFR